MTERRIIAVVGATGAQGGGLVDAILRGHDTGFVPRALTRDPSSDKARALAARGAEVVAADLDDVDSLATAFHDVHGAFCLTNFWEHFSPDKELQQAGNLAAAAKAARVGHVIWSTLEDTRRFIGLDDPRMPTLMERFKVPHFDAKGEANTFFSEAGVPTTYLLTSFYWDNLIHFGLGPRRAEDGVLELVMPMGQAKLPGIAAADIGACAFGLFQEGIEVIGRRVGIAGEHLTGGEMAAALSESLGEPVRYRAISPADFRGLDFPGAADLGNMFQFKQEFEAAFCGARSVVDSRRLHPKLMTFGQWLQRHGSEIPLE